MPDVDADFSVFRVGLEHDQARLEVDVIIMRLLFLVTERGGGAWNMLEEVASAARSLITSLGLVKKSASDSGVVRTRRRSGGGDAIPAENWVFLEEEGDDPARSAEQSLLDSIDTSEGGCRTNTRGILWLASRMIRAIGVCSRLNTR